MGRQRRDRGAAAVELALVAPILFALIAGVVDFSYAYTQRSRVNQGAAAAARQYTVQLRDSTDPNPTSRQAAAKAAAITTFAATSGHSASSVTFTWACAGANCDPSDATICPSASASTPPTIVLTASVPANSITGFFPFISRVTGQGVALCTYSY